MDTPQVVEAPTYRPIPALRKWLEKRGIRQHQLAAMLGVKEAQVSRWLSGRRSLPAATALKIAELTGLPIERLSNRDATTQLLKSLGTRSTTGGRNGR